MNLWRIPEQRNSPSQKVNHDDDEEDGDEARDDDHHQCNTKWPVDDHGGDGGGRS